MRLIFVPQMPARLRYTEWWIDELPKRYAPFFDEVVVLAPDGDWDVLPDFGSFVNAEKAVEYELRQMEMYRRLSLKKGDVLLLADISFAGLFSQILFLKRPDKAFAVCHGSALNFMDLWSSNPFYHQKVIIERQSASLFDGIFVGSKYHKEKLLKHGWTNVIVTGMPHPRQGWYERKELGKGKDHSLHAQQSSAKDGCHGHAAVRAHALDGEGDVDPDPVGPEDRLHPAEVERHPSCHRRALRPEDYRDSRVHLLFSASRPLPQKVNQDLEDRLAKILKVEIVRSSATTWDEYHELLRSSKILLVTAREETFGYQIIDALYCGCVPVAPNDFSYPELLPEWCLYARGSLRSLRGTIQRVLAMIEKGEAAVEVPDDRFIEISVQWMTRLLPP